MPTPFDPGDWACDEFTPDYDPGAALPDEESWACEAWVIQDDTALDDAAWEAKVRAFLQDVYTRQHQDVET